MKKIILLTFGILFIQTLYSQNTDKESPKTKELPTLFSEIEITGAHSPCDHDIYRYKLKFGPTNGFKKFANGMKLYFKKGYI